VKYRYLKLNLRRWQSLCDDDDDAMLY